MPARVGEYSRLQRLSKPELRSKAEKLSSFLQVKLIAKTKKDLASFICCYSNLAERQPGWKFYVS